ncbi:MAG: hypothetical protein ACRELD_02925 [Longimicrobiales bacterium]
MSPITACLLLSLARPGLARRAATLCIVASALVQPAAARATPVADGAPAASIGAPGLELEAVLRGEVGPLLRLGQSARGAGPGNPTTHPRQPLLCRRSTAPSSRVASETRLAQRHLAYASADAYARGGGRAAAATPPPVVQR